MSGLCTCGQPGCSDGSDLVTVPSAAPGDELVADIASFLHSNGDGGVWENFDAVNSLKVARVLLPVINRYIAEAERRGAERALREARMEIADLRAVSFRDNFNAQPAYRQGLQRAEVLLGKSAPSADRDERDGA